MHSRSYPRRNRRVDTLLRGYWDAPILRYDALLVFLVAVQVMFVASRLETPRELLVVCIFHILGLVLEIFKVAAGSWEYPESISPQSPGSAVRRVHVCRGRLLHLVGVSPVRPRPRQLPHRGRRHLGHAGFT